MRKFYSIFALCAFLFLSLAVQAEVLLNEHFNQATSTLATNTDALPFSGEIAASGWTNIMGASGNVYVNNSNDLTYSGYKSATDGTKSAEFKSTFGRRVASPLSASVSSGSVYLAGIVKITSIKSSGKDYLWAFGVGTSGLNSASSKHYARPYVMQSGDGFKFGIAKLDETSTATYIDYTETVYALNSTYLIVVEYTWVDGTKNDIIKMYINPTKGTKPESATCVPKPAQASAKNDAASFGSVILYSSSSSEAACLIDELKVATSWDDLWETGEDPDPEPVVPVPAPAASDKTYNSATISWAAVEGADSYVLQWKVNGGSYSSDIAIDKDVRSFSMSALASETKYFVRVKTIKGEDASEWAEINFTTLAEPDIIVYKEISFNKYSTQDAMPTSGTVYLANHVVEYGGGDPLTTTLTGDLTLNLHGKQLFLYGGHIVVPDGVTFTIYDDAGTGEIKGGYPGSFTDKGLITVQDGGTLVIGEGAVVNLSDGTDDYNIAIDNNNGGTFKLSGAPIISGVREDIHLNSNAITIESGKPLTNSIPYKVFRLAGVITDGWANMSGANPSLFFTSASTTHKGIILNGDGEAELVFALALDEEANTNESRIAAQLNQTVVVAITRSLLTNESFNTFCLPFALSNAQLEEIFGAGYDLEEFVSSEIIGDELVLSFNKVTSLAAGKPYLLQPSVNVVNPAFEGVTITAIAPADQEDDTYISFHGVFNPTELEGGNKNLLFLGAGNELFWPAATGNLNGFRAYFEVKGAAQKAKAARIVKKEDQTQAIDNIENPNPAQKRILNGQLIIEKNGTFYNAQGQIVK